VGDQDAAKNPVFIQSIPAPKHLTGLIKQLRRRNRS